MWRWKSEKSAAQKPEKVTRTWENMLKHILWLFPLVTMLALTYEGLHDLYSIHHLLLLDLYVVYSYILNWQEKIETQNTASHLQVRHIFFCSLPNFGVKDLHVRLLVPSRKNSTGANPFWRKKNNNKTISAHSLLHLSNIEMGCVRSLTECCETVIATTPTPYNK